MSVIIPIRAGLVLALLAFALGLAQPASAAYRYPASEKRAFISSCRQSATAGAGKRLTRTQIETYCSAALACIQDRMTYRRFAETAMRMLSGEANPGAKVFSACMAVAARKAKAPRST